MPDLTTTSDEPADGSVACRRCGVPVPFSTGDDSVACPECDTTNVVPDPPAPDSGDAADVTVEEA